MSKDSWVRTLLKIPSKNMDDIEPKCFMKTALVETISVLQPQASRNIGKSSSVKAIFVTPHIPLLPKSQISTGWTELTS